MEMAGNVFTASLNGRIIQKKESELEWFTSFRGLVYICPDGEDFVI